ncbi:F-box/FBD/LRR-repeat protein At5g56420-like [Benincasa hispida]|uniref:F-box/FBD/LRR-repeat protein At5g56420-like n=1 Tax=Benincasa hispida TaxID=102211 RepID=UPI001902898F|nr:F-box/FBD/LRR-repeat protein At5g56420-like [Benincasa hispida]
MDMDGISHLPDYLLHEILALLDTRQVVQTCVLSKRWKSLWTHIPTLNFDYSSFPFQRLPIKDLFNNFTLSSKACSFERFISGVLEQHRSECIKKLSYSYPIDAEKDFVTAFLSYGQCHNVQQLHITTYEAYESLWSCLSTFKLLTILKITCRPVSDLRTLVLPCLRILEIKRQLNYWDNPYYLDDEYLCYNDVKLNENTFSGYPNLESLVLFDCVLENAGIVIYAPKLENLELDASFFGLTFLKLEFYAPNLKTVELRNIIPSVNYKSSYNSDFVYIDKVSSAVPCYDDLGREHPLQQMMKEGDSVSVL